uniref:KIB1-4 beta-propeller domain-containing protein n=1 Tax=Oryza punctata TaxID=4537 RepID=A0A0E0K1X8_ORYPU
MVLAITPDTGHRRRLPNLATATRAIRLLDPLTGALTDFPAFTVSNVVAAVAQVKPEYVSAVFRRFPWGGTNPYAMDGAGIDDSTSPPTLLLCLRNSLSNIIFAKPGDERWTLVSQGDAFFPQYEREGKVLYHSLLSFHGRCYVTTPEGSVYAVVLSPLPRLARIVQQQSDVCPYRYRHQAYVCSFLAIAGGGGDGGMLMVRYWIDIENFGDRGAYKRSELFTVRGGIDDGGRPVTGRIEVLEVDVAGRRLLPMSGGLGRRAAFVVSSDTFPSVAADAVLRDAAPSQVEHLLPHEQQSSPHEFEFDMSQRLLFPAYNPAMSMSI